MQKAKPAGSADAAGLPLTLGYYVDRDTPCGQASNATLQLLRRTGIGASRMFCEFKRIEKLGATSSPGGSDDPRVDRQPRWAGPHGHLCNIEQQRVCMDGSRWIEVQLAPLRAIDPSGSLARQRHRGEPTLEEPLTLEVRWARGACIPQRAAAASRVFRQQYGGGSALSPRSSSPRLQFVECVVDAVNVRKSISRRKSKLGDHTLGDRMGHHKRGGMIINGPWFGRRWGIARWRNDLQPALDRLGSATATFLSAANWHSAAIAGTRRLNASTMRTSSEDISTRCSPSVSPDAGRCTSLRAWASDQRK